MTPEQLRALLVEVVERAVKAGDLPEDALAGPPDGPLFRPADLRAAGVVADWVTPVAQRWAPALRLAPLDLARVLAQGLTLDRSVASVEVAPSGLLAVTLEDSVRAAVIALVHDRPDDYALEESSARPEQLAEPPGSRPPGDPVRAAQLAHARLCRLVRTAEAAGVQRRGSARLEVLTHVTERHLLVAVADLPQRLHTHEGDPTQQLRAVTDLAALADDWDHPVRPLTADEPVRSEHAVRLALADTVRVVLRNGLARVGASAPERM
ncbi:DALR anticodon-binding domain-containing protein [Terrabacter sp. NPDC000476]|uniref:DALR anticodon-binding domain-containing protein n=1 Tax=Terrabacter sp. NPDC000476 TaxID=3154258 RepID=UPI003328141C